MLPLDSREYKLILDHRLFQNVEHATSDFTAELQSLGKALDIKTKQQFKRTNERQIVFLDTPDFTLQQHNLVLRQRIDDQEGLCYTLKCRTEDRFVAEGRDLAPGKDFESELKLEEDIAAPFTSRYSRSSTIVLTRKRDIPTTLGEAAEMFPGLFEVRVNKRRCSPKTRLEIVNSVHVQETVYKGLEIGLPGSEDRFKASAAIIFWSRKPAGRLAIAEFSFRYKLKKSFTPDVSQAAKDFFQLLQRTDWFRPGAITKTQFIYRSTSHDLAG